MPSVAELTWLTPEIIRELANMESAGTARNEQGTLLIQEYRPNPGHIAMWVATHCPN